MFEPKHRERPRPSSPGETLLRYLEQMRVAAEANGRPHAPGDLDLPGICVVLDLRGLMSSRVEAPGEYIAWYLDSREMLMWHHAGRLWSVWEARDWTRWW